MPNIKFDNGYNNYDDRIDILKNSVVPKDYSELKIRDMAEEPASENDYLYIIDSTKKISDSVELVSSEEFLAISGVETTPDELNEIHNSGAENDDYVKLHNIEVDADEINKLDGVTSNIQSQLDLKEKITNKVTELNVFNDINYPTTNAIYKKFKESVGVKSSTNGDQLEKIYTKENVYPVTKLVNLTDVETTPTELNKLHGLETTKAELGYVQGVTSGIQGQLNNRIKYTDVVDNVTTTTTMPLSANQGKLLNDRINNLESIGRFLSVWNCTTGKPDTNPQSLPYDYHTGDYYRVGTVGDTNYKPDGQSYSGNPSTVVESDKVSVGDIYYYDGNGWFKQSVSAGDIINDVKIENVSIVSGGVANITANNLPNLNASKITEGTFNVDRIPNLPITKIIDVTASSSDLNKLTGLETTSEEFSYVHGVTSSIQDQLNSKVETNITGECLIIGGTL